MLAIALAQRVARDDEVEPRRDRPGPRRHRPPRGGRRSAGRTIPGRRRCGPSVPAWARVHRRARRQAPRDVRVGRAGPRHRARPRPPSRRRCTSARRSGCPSSRPPACASRRSTGASSARTGGPSATASRSRRASTSRWPSGAPPTALDERARLAAEYAERYALDHHGIDDDLWTRLRAVYEDRELVELSMCLGCWLGFGRLNRVFGLDTACMLPIRPRTLATLHSSARRSGVIEAAPPGGSAASTLEPGSWLPRRNHSPRHRRRVRRDDGGEGARGRSRRGHARRPEQLPHVPAAAVPGGHGRPERGGRRLPDPRHLPAAGEPARSGRGRSPASTGTATRSR